MPSSRSRRHIPVVGVTGAIGSGKSSVARLFAGWGAVVVSGDEIGHRVVDEFPTVRRRLAREFGMDIVKSGSIDRSLLARRAFASPAGVRALNRIVHPALTRELIREVRQCQRLRRAKAVVIDAALLVEWGIGPIHWDHLVGVYASYDLRVRRLRRRGLTHAQIGRFARAQMPWREKQKHCDFLVKNDSSLSILRKRARLCWDKLLSST